MNISLTNYIEIIEINHLYQPSVNQFHIVPDPDRNILSNGVYIRRIKDEVAQFKMYESTHTPYSATITDRVKLETVDWDSDLELYKTYFFVNNNISVERDRLEVRLYDIYRVKAGGQRFQMVMPSRGRIFR